VCVFCFWDGYGFYGDAPLLPFVRVPHRQYYLFTGPLGRTGRAFRFDVWEQSPSMWWPADRAWFVATEVDGYSTYVGGTTACVEAVLADPVLEALTVTFDMAIDPGPYA
jgi:hypothetical protein